MNNSKKKYIIIAHRGASHAAPENTLPSFKLAFEENADFIEGDFRLTKDGKVVCIHDATTKRTAPNQKNMRISNSEFEALRSLDFGFWKGEEFKGTQIPALNEILEIIPAGKGIVIEIKDGNPKLLDSIKIILKKYKIPDDKVYIISFDPKVIINSKKKLPEIKAYWLYDWHFSRIKRKCLKVERKIIAALKSLNCDGIDCNPRQNISEYFLDELRNNNFGFFAYTIDNVEEAVWLLSIGAEGITTNSPQRLRSGLENYSLTARAKR